MVMYPVWPLPSKTLKAENDQPWVFAVELSPSQPPPGSILP